MLHRQGRIATVAVSRFIFGQPVSLGDLLGFYDHATRIGITSIGVHADVYAERNPASPQAVKVTEADLTYVAATPRANRGRCRAGRLLST